MFEMLCSSLQRNQQLYVKSLDERIVSAQQVNKLFGSEAVCPVLAMDARHSREDASIGAPTPGIHACEVIEVVLVAIPLDL
jgi:hypothetical protein